MQALVCEAAHQEGTRDQVAHKEDESFTTTTAPPEQRGTRDQVVHEEEESSITTTASFEKCDQVAEEAEEAFTTTAANQEGTRDQVAHEEAESFTTTTASPDQPRWWHIPDDATMEAATAAFWEDWHNNKSDDDGEETEDSDDSEDSVDDADFDVQDYPFLAYLERRSAREAARVAQVQDATSSFISTLTRRPQVYVLIPSLGQRTTQLVDNLRRSTAHQQRRSMFYDTASAHHIETLSNTLSNVVRIPASRRRHAVITGVGGDTPIIAIGSWGLGLSNVLVCDISVALFSTLSFTDTHGGSFETTSNGCLYSNSHTGHSQVLVAERRGTHLVMLEDTIVRLAEELTMSRNINNNNSNHGYSHGHNQGSNQGSNQGNNSSTHGGGHAYHASGQTDTGARGGNSINGDSNSGEYTNTTLAIVPTNAPPLRFIKPNNSFDETNILHQQLGHVSRTKMLVMLRQGRLPPKTTVTEQSIRNMECTACMGGNFKRQKFHKRSHKERRKVSTKYKYGEKMEADVSGPHCASYPAGHRHYLLVFDCASKMIFIRCMINLKKVPEALKEILIEMKSLNINTKFGTIKFDEASYFKSAAMKRACTDLMVHPIYAIPYQHASNSRAETSIRTVNNSARTLLTGPKLSSSYWAHAVKEAVRNYVRQPHQMLPKMQSPMQYIGHPDDLLQRRITFGAQGLIHVPKNLKKTGTFETSTSPVIVLGYNTAGNALELLDARNGMLIHRRDVLVQPDTRHLTLDRISMMLNGENLMLLPGQTQQDLLAAANLDVPEAEANKATASTVPQLAPYKPRVGARPKNTDGTAKRFDQRAGNYVASSEQQNNTAVPDRSELAALITGNNIPPKPPQKEDARPIGKRTRAGQAKILEEQPIPNIGAFLAAESIESPLPEEPNNMKDALTGKDAHLWHKAIDDEATKLVQFQAVSADRVAVQSRLDAGANIVPFVDTFKVKTDKNGAFLKVKYRGCAGGHIEKLQHVGYRDASSPVVDTGALNVLRAVAVRRGMRMHQQDAVSAYLCTKERSPRVVKVSKAFMDRLIKAGLKVDRYSNSLLLAVEKCLYGYDDCGKQFYNLVRSVLLRMGFTPCPDEPCLYKIETLVNNRRETVITCHHVDDFFFAENSTPYFEHIRKELNKYFKFDGVGPLNHFLGTSVEHTPHGLKLHTEPLIVAAAKVVGVLEANPKYTAWPSGATITDETPIPEELDEFSWKFRNVVGIVSYVSQRTRPEILVHCSQLQSKQANPNKNDFQLLKHLVKYLYTTRHLRQCIERVDTPSRGGTSRGGPAPRQRIRLNAACDSDYGGCPVTRKCMSGLNITLNDSDDTTFPLQTSIPIMSRAKRQATVSTSVNEGELKSATEAAKSLVFLQTILDFVDDDVDTPRVHCDNMGAIAIARGIGKRKRSKHIDIKHFYIRELLANRKLTLHHVNTDNNVSDAMTKSLGKTKFLNFRDLLKIR